MLFITLAIGPPKRDNVPGQLHPGQRTEHRARAGRRGGPLTDDQTLQETIQTYSGANHLEVLCPAMLGTRAYALKAYYA